MALVASRKSRLATMARQGKSRAAQALKLLEEPDRLFSTVQIGITLVGVLAGVFGGATLSVHLEAWLAAQPLLADHAAGLSLGIVILCITVLSLVLGELLPKKAAFSDPERFACLTSPAMLLVRAAARPAVGLLAMTSRALARLMGLTRQRQHITEKTSRRSSTKACTPGSCPFKSATCWNACSAWTTEAWQRS
jgi:putative hemolysin